MSKSLFIRGAPNNTTKEDLMKAFSQFGEVLPSTRVVRRKNAPPTAKPLCFVDFATEDGAQNALSHTQSVIVCGVPVDFEEERVQPPSELYFAPVDSPESVRAILSSEARLPLPVNIRMTTKPSVANGELFAFVQFETEDDNNLVVETLNGKTLPDGKMLTVQKSRRSQTTSSRGGGPGGSRGGSDRGDRSGGGRRGGSGDRGDRSGGGGGRFGGPRRGSGSGGGGDRRGGGGGNRSNGNGRSGSGGPSSRRGIGGPITTTITTDAALSLNAPQFTVHVGNLPPGTSPDLLKALFEVYGEVTRVVQKGHANTTVFVEFDSSVGMDKAVHGANQSSGGKLQVTPSKGRANSVHVIGFENHPTEAMVVDAFAMFGNVVSVNILEPRAYAFVSFSSPEGAQRAIAMNEKLSIGNVPLTILESTSTARKGTSHRQQSSQQ
jgi:RNA recognition motif-containing protein